MLTLYSSYNSYLKILWAEKWPYQPLSLAPIRSVFEIVASLFSSNFKAQQCTTIDEMLSLYHDRCPLKVFKKDKPGTYGVPVRMLTDSHKRYIIAM